MDMHNFLSSQSSVLNEQVARQIFNILPDQGPIVVIIDREGHCWPSDSERFSDLNANETFLKEICAKIDDGAEPVITQIDDFGIVGAQLATEHTNCGYVIIALPRYSPESTLVHIDLLEILLNQIGLIVTLIEKNTLLYELQLKQQNIYSQSQSSVN